MDNSFLFEAFRIQLK